MRLAITNDLGGASLVELVYRPVAKREGANRTATRYVANIRNVEKRARRVYEDSPGNYYVNIKGKRYYLELRL